MFLLILVQTNIPSTDNVFTSLPFIGQSRKLSTTKTTVECIEVTTAAKTGLTSGTIFHRGSVSQSRLTAKIRRRFTTRRSKAMVLEFLQEATSRFGHRIIPERSGIPYIEDCQRLHILQFSGNALQQTLRILAECTLGRLRGSSSRAEIKETLGRRSLTLSHRFFQYLHLASERKTRLVGNLLSTS